MSMVQIIMRDVPYICICHVHLVLICRYVTMQVLSDCHFYKVEFNTF